MTEPMATMAGDGAEAERPPRDGVDAPAALSAPLLTPAQREVLLGIGTALFGLAVAISLYPLWLSKAPAGQMPGYLTAQGIDARAPLRFFASVIVLTLGSAALLRPCVKALVMPDSRAWARHLTGVAILVALWHATLVRGFAWTFWPAAIAIALAVLLRRVPMHFEARDAALLPAGAAVFISIADITSLALDRAAIVAAGVVLLVRMALVFIRRPGALAPSFCFTLAPLGLIAQAQTFGRDQRYDGWPALLIALVSPFLLRLLVRGSEAAQRRLRLATVFVIYPLAAYAYTSATSFVTAEGKPRIDFFEDAQHATPAGEMLRGERPYRDIIPPHGLIQDGLLDLTILSRGPVTIGQVAKIRESLGRTIVVTAYAITAAATGSPDLGIVAAFLSLTFGTGSGSARFLPALIALAFLVATARTRSRRLLAAGAASSVVAGLTSVEFGCYSAVVLAVTAWRLDTERAARMRALRAAGIGLLAVAIPAVIAMAAAGFFTDFVRVTMTEVITVGAAYALDPFEAPAPLARQFPDLLPAVFDAMSALYLTWIGSLIALAVIFTRGVRRESRLRLEPMITLLVWVVVAGISYAERHHTYFCFAVAPLLVAAAWTLWHSRSAATRVTGLALATLLLVLSSFTAHLSIVGTLRRTRQPIDANWREVGVPRAQGALFLARDIGILDTVKRYTEAKMRPDETFVDLTNRPMLYFLLDRDVPVRQLEVAFYEREELQREVIARIQNNKRVRAAIVPLPENDTVGSIDFVINAVRVPLVWKYITENFEPDVQEGEVAIWRRKAGR